MKLSRSRLLTCALTALLLAAAGPARAIDVTAGVNQSDLGLYADGAGIVVGVGQNVLPGPGPVQLRVALEYLQRKGSQPRYFSDPQGGLILHEAEVTLHYLQPAAFVSTGFRVADSMVRPFLGASVALKLSESWDEPAGDTAGPISFEDTDFLGHAGFALDFTGWFVDIRHSFGLSDQLIDGTDPSVKMAENLEAGVGQFEPGANVTAWQFSLGVDF